MEIRLRTISPFQGLDLVGYEFSMGQDPSLCYCAPLGLMMYKGSRSSCTADNRHALPARAVAHKILAEQEGTAGPVRAFLDREVAVVDHEALRTSRDPAQVDRVRIEYFRKKLNLGA